MDQGKCSYVRIVSKNSHAAYYRHLEDRTGCICPGKRNPPSSESDSSESFDFDHSDETAMGTSMVPAITPQFIEPYSSDEMANTDDYSEDNCESGEEIWESSESEDDEPQTTHVAGRMLKGIAFFLTKYQLLFKISERAMTALLIFLGTVFTFLSGFIKHPLLTELYQILPRTMWKIKYYWYS